MDEECEIYTASLFHPEVGCQTDISITGMSLNK